MLAHSESSNVGRPHEPVRNSTLRQVASTTEDPKVDATHLANLQHPVYEASQPEYQTIHGKVVTIGIHDGSSSSSNALLDPSLLPQSAVDSKVLLGISPTTHDDDDDDLATNGQAYDLPSRVNRGKNMNHEHIDGTKRYLLIAEPMGSDSAGKSSDIQLSIPATEATRYGVRPHTRVLVSVLDFEDHQASHVEIAFRDEYLSRSDMWRLVVSELAGKVIHKGQRLAFMSTIKASIKAIYLRGQRVQSAFFSASTKPVFRSESARYVLFIQMSKEMWDFDTDGTGQIMFDKVINGFLPDLFKRWQQINARHLVTIVLFTRLESQQAFTLGPVSVGTRAAEQDAARAPPLQDYYRVVVSDMPSGDWSDILIQLKKEFRVFLRDVSIRHPAAEGCSDLQSDPQAASDRRPPIYITGHPLAALHGNILEAVNLASSQFSCDYIDRDLVRTGISVIVITPGTGLFEVDYDLLATTTDNLIENGVGIDLVCLSKIPLHSVPLFKYRPPKLDRLQLSSEKAHQTFDDPPWDHRMTYERQLALQENPVQSSLKSSLENGHEASGTGWNYGIPHWVDVSYWAPPSAVSQIPAVPIDKPDHTVSVYDRRGRKPFIPRVRMYELQMMGVIEGSVNQIRLPYLPKSLPNPVDTLTAPSSLLEPPPPRSQSPPHERLMARTTVESKLHVSSSSITSTSSLYASRKDPKYRWMDEYDARLFQHPKRRQRHRKEPRPSSLVLSSLEKRRQRDRMNSGSGFALSASNSLSGSIPSLNGRGDSDLLKGEHDPLKKSTKAGPRTTDSLPTGSRTQQSGQARTTRQFSLGFRGFGVRTPKATASTEVSTAHARSAAAVSRGQHTQGKSQDKSSVVPSSLEPSEKPNGRDSASTFKTKIETPQEFSQKILDPARPIPIQNPTGLRNIPRTGASQSREPYHPTLLTFRSDDDHFVTKASWQQPSPLHTQAADMLEDDQPPPMSPRTAMAPWLTVVNPSNPKTVESNTTSRLGRWQHIFPKKLRASKIKWKSLCSPAAVPLTTEEFPSADELATEYELSKYQVDLPADDELLERPRTKDWLTREMMAFRFSQGFQVVIGPRLANALYLPNFGRFDVFDDSELSKTDTTIIMSKGSMIHKISAAESGHVGVECMIRRSVAAQLKDVETKGSKMYRPMIRTMLASNYLQQNVSIGPGQGKYDWTMIDAHIANHPKQEMEQYDENLRSWRARLVLIPVNPSSSTRRPLQPLNEDNEEELRLEGIKKLTQLWQRFRYVPPSERRFQASTRKRKDINPLDIMYQTRNPSAIVAAEKGNLGEDVSTGKPVQLLPECELFQRSNLNLQTLAQTIQGERGVRMVDRRWHWRLHYSCFIGFELTSWLLQNFRDVDTREEAVELGNDLMKEGLFQHVEQRHNFRDGNYFYQVASDYRAARPESRNTWFGSKKAEKVPSTPLSEGQGQESPKAPGSRSSQTNKENEKDASAHTANRQRLGVALSKSLLYDVDHRKRSYRPELITLHYDRLHNPDNCYHIRIDWMNATAKLIEDAIVSWANSVERFGLRLVEVPLAEASTITGVHPFRAPALVRLTKSPPSEQPQTYFDATSFIPQARAEKHFYQKALMKKFDFVLDFEAASDFPADVDVTYSWGKPDYKYPQYIHRSGTLLAQITDEGDFLLLANRLYNDRTHPSHETKRSDNSKENDTSGMLSPTSAPRSDRHRGSPHASPYASPLIRASTGAVPNRPAKPSTTFSTPEQIKKQFEAFCGDETALERFYSDVLSKASTPAAGTPSIGTPMMESSIPALGLPPSLVERGKSPAPSDAARPKTRIVGGSPMLGTRASGD
ncbi:MAG: hypothetical protein LQ338_005290 [Usnochroma carphineum]|nr:MAG: hypothetical protein LQ338_005290 [Usnochroma carphineum]